MNMSKSTFCLLGVLMVAMLGHTYAADWAAYRHDAARSAFTDEALPNRLKLRWSLQASPARPAWPTSQRMRFDDVCAPIIVGDQVVIGSSADDRVTAIDAKTGTVRWSFVADGPVRFAPVAWRDRVLVASDDGNLYALALRDGGVLWKHRGGPTQRAIIGNDRIISRWPARGGPVVVDDTVYYSAGIWPSDGVYIHAIDPATGALRWTNDSSGSIEMPQPHGGAVARSGVAPQGYLLADRSRLFVPTGRSVPAVFSRDDGRFLYYQLQANQKRGGTAVALVGSFFLNSGCLFDNADGSFAANVGLGPVVVKSDGMVRAEGASLAEYRWVESQRPDRKGTMKTIRALQNMRIIRSQKEILSLIAAGIDVVCGEDGSVCAIDYTRQQNRWWSHDVEGKALGLAYGNGRLVVSTDKGYIYCFDGEPDGVLPSGRAASVDRTSRGDVPTSLPAVSSGVDYGKWADAILRESGVRRGYCVDWGCGDGQLALELARRSDLQVYAVESDPKRVAAARHKMVEAGIYGTRVTVHQADLKQPRYPARFANLVVSSRSVSGSLPELIVNQVRRMQRPNGGALCLGLAARLQVEFGKPLVGAGNWTHQNAGPENTICSMDQLVHGRVEMCWFRDVPFRVPNRHGQGPAPLYRDGYLIVGGVDGVCCVDAFNGSTVWTYSVPGLLQDFDGMHHDVGVGEAGSSLCLGPDSVYVKHGPECLRLDLATGRKIAAFTTPADTGDKRRDWGFVAFSNGTLFGTVANEQHRVSARYTLVRLFTESVLLFAMDPDTGRIKWTYRPRHSIRNNAVTIGAGVVYLIDRPIALADQIVSPHRDGKQGPLLKPGDQPGGTIVALQVADGTVIWKQPEDVFGTQLAISTKHHVLLMNYEAVRHNFFRLPSEIGGRLAGIDSRSGKRLWDRTVSYRTRPIICDETIYADGGAWSVQSGADVPFEFQRSYGCGQIAAGARTLVFRSATLGYGDIGRKVTVRNFGGVRSGCWITAIPAGGMILAPNGAAHCTCSYQTQPWMALQPVDVSSESK